MSKDLTYESVLADVLSELVGVSLDYAGSGVSDVFVYASIEGAYSFDPFFANSGELYRRHKLPNINTSVDRQDALLDYGNGQLLRLIQQCSILNHPVPTEIKLHYVVATGKTDADLKYEPQWSNTPDLSVHDISEEWQEQVRLMLASQRSV